MIIRQTAFENKSRKMLKGGLHCHTTRSDGQGTPEEVIAKHVENGYSFLALTDHNFYNFKNFTDLPITIIPGMEINGNITDPRYLCFHTVCLGPVEGNGYEQDFRHQPQPVADYREFQPYLDEVHARGNLTLYCHPEWSYTPAEVFMQLKGNFGMEIWNTGCAEENHMDTNAAYWDQILGEGIRLWGVATDDGHPMTHHCRGWVMVDADNDVPSILDALKDGRFYSSTGPEIYDFYVEDGVAKIECSPAESVEFISWMSHPRVVNGEALTSAEAKISANARFIRASVIDKDGHRAWTNPIFFD